MSASTEQVARPSEMLFWLIEDSQSVFADHHSVSREALSTHDEDRLIDACARAQRAL